MEECVSIHAPQWGATANVVSATDVAGFNSRTPVGCDRTQLLKELSDRVSIHAPQWGATTVDGFVKIGKDGFNSRTPVGCDYASI